MADVINTKTVIIGAGVSGISTAVQLLQQNYKDFLVFEALERIGGRVNTIDYGNGFLENGAQFIHGQKSNPIYYIARDNQLIDSKFNQIIEDSDSEDDTDSKYIHAMPNGTQVESDMADKLADLLEEAYGKMELEEDDEDKEKDISIGEAFYQGYLKLVGAEFDKDLSDESEKKFKQIVDGMFIYRCRSENVETGSNSVYDTSLKNFGAYEECAGADIELTDGYRSVIDCIVEPVRDNFYSRLNLGSPLKKMLLCRSLESIQRVSSAASRVGSATHRVSSAMSCEHCLYTRDKKKVVLLFENKVVVCDNVVCTMSLGYMKENLHKIIEPASLVPEEKLQAVKRLGFGTVNKVGL